MKFTNTKLLFLVFGVLGAFLAIYIYQKTNQTPRSSSPTLQPSINTATDSPRIVSTKPEPLEEAIIAADQIIEITFNRPLENVGEFKSKIEPKIDYKVELSSDRKTAKIIPLKSFELGSTYTLFIGPESKFDGAGRWGEEKIYHFQTIKYRGI